MNAIGRSHHHTASVGRHNKMAIYHPAYTGPIHKPHDNYYGKDPYPVPATAPTPATAPPAVQAT